jgi:hypothetical protein
MPTHDQDPPRVDSAHIWAICTSAGPARDRRGITLLAGGRHGIHVHMPTRASARDAEAALIRVGYHVVRATDHNRGRHLVVRGWSADALEARLTTMRSVLEQLAADPSSTATKALDRLGGLPAAGLPDSAGQQQLSRQAAAQLLRWIFTTSGVHAPHDPLAQPPDAGCALRLSAAWRLEEAIEDLAARQVRVAANALALYPVLRQHLGHDSARDIAVRQASITFHLSRPIAQDSTPLLRSAYGTPDLAPSAGDAPARTSGRSGIRSGPRLLGCIRSPPCSPDLLRTGPRQLSAGAAGTFLPAVRHSIPEQGRHRWNQKPTLTRSVRP